MPYNPNNSEASILPKDPTSQWKPQSYKRDKHHISNTPQRHLNQIGYIYQRAYAKGLKLMNYVEKDR